MPSRGVQRRDLDGALLTVRSGTARKARRMHLTQGAICTLTACLKIRLPSISMVAECEPLLMKRNVTQAEAPGESGVKLACVIRAPMAIDTRC